MDVVDRYLPDKERHAMLRGDAGSPRGDSNLRARTRRGDALCLAFAMTAPGPKMIRKLEGRHRALCAQIDNQVVDAGGTLRLHARVEESRPSRVW